MHVNPNSKYVLQLNGRIAELSDRLGVGGGQCAVPELRNVVAALRVEVC